MSKINEIQNGLLEIESGNFQKLCEAYFFEQGYKVISYGSVLGSNKTRKGKPDLYIIQDDKFIFIECSTDKTLKLRKLKNDLEDCFNFKKTKIDPQKIVEVKLCYNFILAPNDADILLNIGKKHKCKIDLIDISILSNELNWKYPHLANKFLGIPYDTNQILKPIQFMNEYSKNKLTIGFDNKFMFREKEIKLCLEELETKNVLIIRGEAGSGKTRFALKLQELFSEKKRDFECFVIMNKGISNIYEDSQTYFKAGHKYIIIIDDANRGIVNLKVLLSFLSKENIEIKLIITVRDYAHEQIRKITNEYLLKAEILIKNFEYKELEEILKSLNLRWEAIEKIYQVTKGNPRLSIMCSKYALDTNKLSSLNDVSKIFESYYETALDELEYKNKNQLKVLGIVSYLRTIDKNNELLFEKINKIFNIDKTTFWDEVFELNNKEVLNLYENFYAKFSDQVFQNYIFYKIFFKDELLDYGLLLLNFSDDFKSNNLFLDTLNPTLNSFDFYRLNDKLKKHFTFWIEKTKDSTDIMLRVIKYFWFVNPQLVIGLITEYINNLQNGDVRNLKKIIKSTENSKKYENITDIYLDILEEFRQSYEYFIKSLELIFRYVIKKPNLYPRVLKYIINSIMFDRFSYNERYYYQSVLFDFLIANASNGKHKFLYDNIIYKISNSYLETFRYVSWMSDRMTMCSTNITIRFTEEIKQLRKKIFNYIFFKPLINKDRILFFLNKYIHTSDYYLQEEIYNYDIQFIVPFINNSLNPKNFPECKIVNEYISFLEKRVKYNKLSYLKKKFSNETYKVYTLLRWDEKREIRMNSEDFNKLLTQKFNNVFKNYNLNNYKELFKQFEEILNNCKDHIDYQIRGSIQIILLNLILKNKNIFFVLINHILSNGNITKIIPSLIYNEIFKLGKAYTKKYYELIRKYDYFNKNYWLISFFQYIPKEFASKYYVNEFYNLLNGENLNHICITDYSFLLSFAKFDKNVFINSLKIILQRAKSKKFQADFTYLLFRIEDNEDILNEVINDIDVLEQIYLYQINNRPMDYSKKIFKIIIEHDSDFIIKYLKYKFQKKSFITSHDEYGDLGVLWEAGNYEYMIDKSLEFCRKKIKYEIINSYKNVFFNNIPFSGKVESYIKSYIKRNIKNINKINYIFSIITNNYPDKRLDMVKYLFVEIDNNFKYFEKLYLETESWNSSGNVIPLYEKFVDFWENIKLLLIELKKYEHLLFVESKINKWKSYIKKELRDNFIEV